MVSEAAVALDGQRSVGGVITRIVPRADPQPQPFVQVDRARVAPAWSTWTAAEDPGAPFMNKSPKYVVSSTLQNVGWSNSTILGAYSAETIRSLKQRIEGDIYGAWSEDPSRSGPGTRPARPVMAMS